MKKKLMFIFLVFLYFTAIIAMVISYPLRLLREYFISPEITTKQEVMTIFIIAASILAVSLNTKANFKFMNSIMNDNKEEE